MDSMIRDFAVFGGIVELEIVYRFQDSCFCFRAWELLHFEGSAAGPRNSSSR